MGYLLTRASVLLLAVIIQACTRTERPSNDNSLPATQNQNSAPAADVLPINKNLSNSQSENTNSVAIEETPSRFTVGQSLSEGDFKQSINNSSTPALVLFTAQWCQPCKILVPKIETLAQRYKTK